MPPSLDGLPLIKPPYSRVTAIDLNRGEISWTSPFGDGPRDHPLLRDLNVPALGNGVRGGPLVTKTLLFVSMGQGNIGANTAVAVGNRPISPRPPPQPIKFHVYDKATGAPVWEVATPIGPLAPPMTYLYQGTQYLVMAGGAGLNAELIAYAVK